MSETILLACVVSGLTAAAEPAKEKWNVLFLVSDDLCCQTLGCYGDGLARTPNIDRLAGRGVRFERAYCQYPLCNPSRASLLTGMRPDQTGVVDNGVHFRNVVPDVVTLPQLFRNNGYYVARVGKLYHYGVPKQIGTSGLDDADSWQEVVNPRGDDTDVEDRIFSLVPGEFGGTLSWLAVETDAKTQTDGIGATEAIHLLEKHKGEPFFLAVGFYRPHTPFVAPRSFFDLYPRDQISLPGSLNDDLADVPRLALTIKPEQSRMSDDLRRECIQAYRASTSLMDEQVGRVLDALDRLALTDRTVVVFLSDHGYHLGEHGLWQKQSLFEESARVPLVISAPGAKGNGQGCSALAELIDVYPTLADLCGMPWPEHLAGRSLRAQLDDPSMPGKGYALTQVARRSRPRGPVQPGYSLRTDRWRYTEWDRGAQGRQLYDHANDPEERKNLANDASFDETRHELKSRLDEVVGR